jgi:hypothetical protein
MRSHFLSGLRLGLCALLWLLPVGTGAAQESRSEDIRFFTADQAELAGTFYPGTRGARSPAVLLLHKIGGSRRDGGWEALARALQKNGYSVLSFDFRGHGESTTVHEGFWQVPAHKTLRGAHPARQTLSLRDFAAPYHYAALANDIAAARTVLELKTASCDPTNIVLIGEGTGATLGLLWIAAEWQRWRLAPGPVGPAVRQGLEGHDITCGLWLSIDPVLDGKRAAPVASWLESLVRKEVPLGFLYGEKDKQSAGFSQAIHADLQKGGKEGVHPQTAARAIDDTDASGSELLAQHFSAAERLILTYLKTVLKERRTSVRARPDPNRAPAVVPVERFGFR